MKDIETIIRDNREAFDRQKVDADHWTHIRQSLKSKNVIARQPKWSIRRSMMAVAASILVVACVYFFFGPESQEVTNFEMAAIELPSPEGEMIALDPTQNKYTLVHFWESGNVLCSDDHCYYYLPAYEKYKSKGFEIYAISLDTDKENWVNGIIQNDLPWLHVSDLKGWQSPVCIECSITKVPTSFLLDQYGNIIIRNLEAHALEETLAQLFAM